MGLARETTLPALRAQRVSPFHPQTGTRAFCSRVLEPNQLNAGAYERGGGVGRGLGDGVDLGSAVAVAVAATVAVEVGVGVTIGVAVAVGVAVGVCVAVAAAVGAAVAVGEAHSPIANLFRCYFAILITGADAVLVADAARPCVVQP